MATKITVVDIETSHLSPKYGNILEIGIVTADLDAGKIEEVFNSLIKENDTFNRDAWIFKNSNLKPEEIDDAPSLESMREEIQEIFDKYPVTAFNSQFDYKFLKDRNFIIKNEAPCIMHKSSELLTPLCKSGRISEVQTYKTLFENPNYIEKHRAVDDAYEEAEIMLELHKRGAYDIEIKK